MGSQKYIKLAVAKELANIIRPLVGQSPQLIKNTQQFVDYIQSIKLEPGEVITSYDVKPLFTPVPDDPAISIVQQKLQQDPLLSQRTNMSIPHIVNPLRVLSQRHVPSSFKVKYNKQVHGAAMGSPISPLIANLFMEEFEVKALNSAPTPGSGL